MLQQPITNSLETQRNYKTEKYDNGNETLLHGINRRVKMTKDRVTEPDHKSRQFTQSYQDKRNSGRKRKGITQH